MRGGPGAMLFARVSGCLPRRPAMLMSMTAARIVDPGDDRSFVGAPAAEVLAALIPEEAVEFEAEWRAALTRATKTLDLTEVMNVLESWRLIARHTVAHGAEAHRQMYRRAAARLTGADVPEGESVAVTKERLGL